jgi:hypothetical protein
LQIIFNPMMDFPDHGRIANQAGVLNRQGRLVG